MALNRSLGGRGTAWMCPAWEGNEVLRRCPANKREAGGRSGELGGLTLHSCAGSGPTYRAFQTDLLPPGLSFKPSDLEEPPEPSVCARGTSGLSDQTDALGKRGINKQPEDQRPLQQSPLS